MNNAIFRVPAPSNEPVLSYAPGSPEREALKAKLKEMGSSVVDIPMFIGGKEVRTGKLGDCRPPHDHQRLIGRYHKGAKKDINDAIRAALKARKAWAATPFHERAAVFLRASELLRGPYRQVLNAATMLCQSKSAYQAEIDAACELSDFWSFNVKFAEEIYQSQPYSPRGQWNRLEYRPLEGFVYAVTPFNFTAIAGNLPTSPALMGNTVVWKPAASTMYSGHFILQILRKAGLPDGVINMVAGSSSEISDALFASPDFAGVHFTGSTGVFNSMWKTVGDRVASYRTYPRLVGETGGKDFVVVHPSADPAEVATALVRGAFEYQGQKCSAASRAYIPEGMWNKVRKLMAEQLARVKMGDPEDFSNFVNAVIDRNAYESITAYIKAVRPRDGARIIFGGKFSDEKGYFIEPTVIKAAKPDYKTMCEEIFGPVLTIHTYPDKKWTETLKVCDKTSPYALTGAVFADDRAALKEAAEVLVNAAGNLYFNDKPTGAVVGQQPFGGARASGTNDKAGSFLNLIRWTSARNVKETFAPPADFAYPFLAKP
ncbi:MAG: L-glutamate gamma-semialdehyde dehydrogenase [Elusimicrobia bacterium]|nr:L-glutamate gamma-semialdehyde dehydrogenase [Elusimicrobiota bacterium]